MEAIYTADGNFKYDQEYCGKTLDKWAQEAHKHNCKVNGWKFCPLKKGAYGYDNLCMSFGYVFEHYDIDELDELDDLDKRDELNVDQVASLIHDGWVANYLYWRDNKPYDCNDYNYRKPYKPINDKRRNKCADTPYDDLPNNEKKKDLVFAKFILKSLSR